MSPNYPPRYLSGAVLEALLESYDMVRADLFPKKKVHTHTKIHT
jgi:hypothetical protein